MRERIAPVQGKSARVRRRIAPVQGKPAQVKGRIAPVQGKSARVRRRIAPVQCKPARVRERIAPVQRNLLEYFFSFISFFTRSTSEERKSNINFLILLKESISIYLPVGKNTE
ncbi:hypothetical protein [Lysinibacillus pakistanensis]|uniref:hypothetical protein n=1 Tax=Lysinibacillus pakistanensis TaxID=759811 RepID=UPI003D2B3A1C